MSRPPTASATSPSGPLRSLAALLVAAALLASCASTGNQAAQGSPGGQATQAATGPTAAGSATATVTETGAPGAGASPRPTEAASPTEAGIQSPGPDEFVNPVLEADFPDPHVIEADGTYYAYATGLQMTRSEDLVEWESPRRLDVERTWATRDFWAPEVLETSAGYVMYYTGRSDLDRPTTDFAQCVGRAVSKTPEGPFVDDLRKPFVCQPKLGGTIDASPFVDRDGKLYLLFKNDGNCCGIPTEIFIQPMTDDGLKLTGKPKSLGIRNDVPWEGSVIEAPTLWFHAGTYYLFYSANAYNGAAYAVGYATSKSLLGPYRDAPDNPVLHANFQDLQQNPEMTVAGPGHQSIIEDDDGDLWMVYHAWGRKQIGYELGGKRTMWIDELVFQGGKAVVEGPDDQPQARP